MVPIPGPEACARAVCAMEPAGRACERPVCTKQGYANSGATREIASLRCILSVGLREEDLGVKKQVCTRRFQNPAWDRPARSVLGVRGRSARTLIGLRGRSARTLINTGPAELNVCPNTFHLYSQNRTVRSTSKIRAPSSQRTREQRPQPAWR